MSSCKILVYTCTIYTCNVYMVKQDTFAVFGNEIKNIIIFELNIFPLNYFGDIEILLC